MDFLPRAFEAYGLPLALYVDYHSFFFSQIPESLTYLGEALHFYDISFKYASTPQAKGKIERQHQVNDGFCIDIYSGSSATMRKCVAARNGRAGLTACGVSATWENATGVSACDWLSIWNSVIRQTKGRAYSYNNAQSINGDYNVFDIRMAHA